MYDLNTGTRHFGKFGTPTKNTPGISATRITPGGWGRGLGMCPECNGRRCTADTHASVVILVRTYCCALSLRYTVDNIALFVVLFVIL